MQTGDPGGFLKQKAAVARFGVDQRADPALTNKRGGARPRRLIGKQDMDIAGAHIGAVDLVIGALLTLDTPGNFQIVGVIELAWGCPISVVETQDNFGRVARRAFSRCRQR